MNPLDKALLDGEITSYFVHRDTRNIIYTVVKETCNHRYALDRVISVYELLNVRMKREEFIKQELTHLIESFLSGLSRV